MIIALLVILASYIFCGFYIHTGLQQLRIESKNNKRNFSKSSGKRKANAYAICRSRQKRYGWSEEKYKRCIEKIQSKEREKDYEEEMADDAEDSSYGDLVPKFLRDNYEKVGE